MKYSEFHRRIVKNGWSFVKSEGSHYFYEKNGVLSPPVPFHGSKEMYEPLRRSIERKMGFK
ncbi:MAG: type II toxin-antitoxin system HicA family toxin [Mangrovibacterium sp.]